MRTDPPSRLLVADDQPDVIEALRLLLKPEGYSIDTAASPQQIVRALETKDFDVVLMDLNYARDTTSGEEGLDLLSRIRLADEALPGVVMTAWGSVDVAVAAMRRPCAVPPPWCSAMARPTSSRNSRPNTSNVDCRAARCPL